MPDPVIEPPPAELNPTVAPTGADPTAQPDVVPESVSKLLKNLQLDVDAPERKPEPEAKAEPKEPKPGEPKAAPAGKPEPAKAESKPGDPAADPGIKLRKPPKPVRPDLPIAQPAAAAPPAPKDEPYKPDPQWESGLDEEQKEMLADAQFMEARFPDKYKGWAARTAKFLRDHAAEAAKPEFDAESPKYKAWLQTNQPRLTREQIREIEAARVTDTVRKEYDGKLADVQHKLFVREHEPKIEAEGKSIFVELSHSALPDDITQAIKKDGFDKANEVFALEIETAQNVLTAATIDLQELRRLATKDPETGRPLQASVNDPAHPKFAQHQRLGELVGYLDEQFKKNGTAEEQQRDGKWFVTRDEWSQIRPDQRHRFWTFKLEEYIPRAKANAKEAVQIAIEQKRAGMKKLGWQPPAPKAAAPAAPPKAEPPQPTNAPRTPGPSPAPGAIDPMSEIDARAARMSAQLNRE